MTESRVKAYLGSQLGGYIRIMNIPISHSLHPSRLKPFPYLHIPPSHTTPLRHWATISFTPSLHYLATALFTSLDSWHSFSLPILRVTTYPGFPWTVLICTSCPRVIGGDPFHHQKYPGLVDKLYGPSTYLNSFFPQVLPPSSLIHPLFS